MKWRLEQLIIFEEFVIECSTALSSIAFNSLIGRKAMIRQWINANLPLDPLKSGGQNQTEIQLVSVSWMIHCIALSSWFLNLVMRL